MVSSKCVDIIRCFDVFFGYFLALFITDVLYKSVWNFFCDDEDDYEYCYL